MTHHEVYAAAIAVEYKIERLGWADGERATVQRANQIIFWTDSDGKDQSTQLPYALRHMLAGYAVALGAV